VASVASLMSLARWSASTRKPTVRSHTNPNQIN